jgi:hypothetical protein
MYVSNFVQEWRKWEPKFSNDEHFGHLSLSANYRVKAKLCDMVMVRAD